MKRSWPPIVLAVTAVLVLALVGLGLAVALTRGSTHPNVASGTTTTAAGTQTTTAGARTSTSQAKGPTTRVATVPGAASGPVPAGFEPQSVTFTSPADGWVLGTAPCSSPPCTSVLRTVDRARTWSGINAPRVALAASPEQPAGVSELRFADRVDGWAFGPALWATHDGARSWHPINLPGPPGTTVIDLAVSAGRAYALGMAAGTGVGSVQLYTSPATVDAWSAVPGVGGPAYSGSQIALHGSAAFVLIGPGPTGTHLWYSPAGAHFVARRPPCTTEPYLAAPTTDGVVAVCGGGTGLGQQAKTVLTSADAGATWRSVGQAPLEGDLEGVTAASPSTIVVAASSGASWLYASFDGGRSWRTVRADDTGGQPWHDLGLTTAAQGVAVEGSPPAALPRPQGGSGAPGSFPPSRLLGTLDGGHAWVPVVFRAAR